MDGSCTLLNAVDAPGNNIGDAGAAALRPALEKLGKLSDLYLTGRWSYAAVKFAIDIRVLCVRKSQSNLYLAGYAEMCSGAVRSANSGRWPGKEQGKRCWCC